MKNNKWEQATGHFSLEIMNFKSKCFKSIFSEYIKTTSEDFYVLFVYKEHCIHYRFFL